MRVILLLAAVLVATAVPTAASAASATVLIPSGGGDRPTVSADGRFVTFDSSADGSLDVFLHDRQRGVTEVISVSSAETPGNGGSFGPAGIGGGGRYVVFTSSATNLVPGDTNGVGDIFVRDRRKGTTKRVSVSSNGLQGNGFSELPRISASGRYVLFSSEATNLVRGDTNGRRDVFVHDLYSGTTHRITSDVDGDHDPGGISSDGRFIGYLTTVNDIGTAYVKDLRSGRVELVGTDATEMSLSADGRRAAVDDAFGQIHFRDLTTGATDLVTVNVSGQPSSGSASHGAISANGRFVGFVSNAGDLPGGFQSTNGVFIRDLYTATTFKASLRPDGQPFGDWSGVGGIANVGITFTNGGEVYLRTF
jgi:Tol biopolymer transport system component